MKYSQEDLAGFMNVSKTTVSNWENESVLIASDKLVNLAELMGVSVDYLSGVTDIEPGNEAKEITAMLNIFYFDPISHTIRINAPLDDYLKSLGKIYVLEREQGDLFTDDLFQMILKSIQEKYVGVRQQHMEDMAYIEYEVFPKGYLDKKLKEKDFEYSRLPPLAAGGDSGPEEW